MSGGHFDYEQCRILNAADDLEELILNPPEWTNYRPETWVEFTKALYFLCKAAAYLQRVDWLLSGDDGEDRFHERLKEDLEHLEKVRSRCYPGWRPVEGGESKMAR